MKAHIILIVIIPKYFSLLLVCHINNKNNDLAFVQFAVNLRWVVSSWCIGSVYYMLESFPWCLLLYRRKKTPSLRIF